MMSQGTLPAIGTAVMVRWSDGAEYPAEVGGVQGDQVLCRFTNGNAGWVGAAFVRVVAQPGAHVQHGNAGPGQSAQAPTKSKNQALIVGIVAAGLALVIGAAAVGFVLIKGSTGGDAALSSYSGEASKAILSAALSKPHDPKWNGGNPTDDLRGTDADAKRILASLGGEPRVVLTTFEIEATRRDGSGHKNLRSIAAVLSSGEVRWFVVSRRRFDWADNSAMTGLSEVAPVLDKSVTRVVREMAGECKLPILGEEHLATLPADVRRQLLRDVSDIPKACAPGDDVTGWEPRVDDVSVLVESGGKWALLRSQLKLEGGLLRLTPVRVKLVGGAASSPPTQAVQEAPPPGPPSAGAVSIGTVVKALGVDATAIDGKVVDFYGKLAKVEHTRGGYVEWLYLNKTTPAGTPLPDPRGDSCSVLVGQRVKAKWPYSKTDTYLARVGEVYGKMARVVYSDDGKLQWSPCEELDPVF